MCVCAEKEDGLRIRANKARSRTGLTIASVKTCSIFCFKCLCASGHSRPSPGLEVVRAASSAKKKLVVHDFEFGLSATFLYLYRYTRERERVCAAYLKKNVPFCPPRKKKESFSTTPDCAPFTSAMNFWYSSSTAAGFICASSRRCGTRELGPEIASCLAGLGRGSK